MTYATTSAFLGEAPHRAVPVYNLVQAHGTVSCARKKIPRCHRTLPTFPSGPSQVGLNVQHSHMPLQSV
jgi:hypothetical protein